MLTGQSLDAFHQATVSVHSASSIDDLTQRLLTSLLLLVPADACLVNWFGLPARPVVTFYEPSALIGSDINRLAHLFLHQHPGYGRRHTHASSISDHMSKANWHRTDMHALTYGKVGLEDGLGLDIDLGLGCTLTVEIIRARRGFTDTERRMLDHFRAHIALAYRRLAPAPAARPMPGQCFLATTLRVWADGSVEFAARGSLELLARYFSQAPSHRLPDGLARWVSHAAASLARPGDLRAPVLTQRLGRPGRVLAIHCMPDGQRPGVFLISLEETSYDEANPRGFRISPREREVLRWAASGMANHEIAAAAAVSPGTVKRHLENIYRKLEVGDRHAAVRSARHAGLLD